METTLILHILRNPWGWPQVEQRQARLAASDLIEAQAEEIALLRQNWPAEREWQPMETAPRDGTAILVILPQTDIPKAARWDYKQLRWIHTWDLTPFHNRNEPIYWMPIADLPQVKTP